MNQPPIPRLKQSHKAKARVSIGVPVYNGENYLELALDALLAQTFHDFELIISDNGSNDRTEAICRSYASQDHRIRYYRNETNQGAASNFNRLVELANSEYFMWASHDDLWAPEYIEKCVLILDENPDVILCYAGTEEIDENGKSTRSFEVNPDLASTKACNRFSACWKYPPQIPVFGLMRTSELKKTRLLGKFSSADRILVGHLALLGPLYGIPETLFFYRRHPEQSTGNPLMGRHAYISWYDTKKRNTITFPHWRLLREHLKSISRTRLNWSQRPACYLSLARWTIRHRRRLTMNLLLRE